MTDLSPWEDINPATALAKQRVPASKSLDPVDVRRVFRNELTACLTLVAPVGMDEEARRDWLAVAWQTLKHIPADILEAGAAAARKQCDHPSKIVPTIVAETAEQLRWRREGERNSGTLSITAPSKPRHVMDRRGEAMSEADTAELNNILTNLGATMRYRADGSRYAVSAAA